MTAASRPPALGSRQTHPDLWATLVIAIAVAIGVAITSPLEVPPEVDHYRDMGAAEAMLADRWGQDPAFLGETAWYPPLLPALMAMLARFTGLPLATLYVHAGPLLNAAAPTSFYLLARYALGGWTAVLSLVGFLFITNSATNSWEQASYSPWVWPVLFAQAFFYLTLKAWLEASERPSIWRSCLAGALLGLTFLAHPAPAVLLTLTIVSLSVFRIPLAPTRRKGILERLLITGAVSALVCAPFLVPLMARYGLSTQNPIPSRFGGVWISDVIRSHLSLRTLGALVAVVWLWHCVRRASTRSLRDWSMLTAWGWAAVGLVYGIVAQKLELRGVQAPLLFPTFHFHFYVLAIEALLFGPGLVWLTRCLVKRAPSNFSERVATKRWFAPLAVLGLVVAVLPRYRARDDFTHWPAESRKLAQDVTLRSVYDWARRELGPRDVVLASSRLGMYAIVASGHGILSTYPSMTNPYVAVEPREAARQALFEQLRSRRFAQFAVLAAKYGVTHVVAEHTDEACCSLPSIDSPEFRVVHRTPNAVVYALPTGSRYAQLSP